MTDHLRLHLVVRGRVQGVGFRWSCRTEAEARGLTGYAMNRGDGSVEIELEGRDEDVRGVATWARSGPPGAEVDEVSVTEIPLTDTEAVARPETGFRVG